MAKSLLGWSGLTQICHGTKPLCGLAKSQTLGKCTKCPPFAHQSLLTLPFPLGITVVYPWTENNSLKWEIKVFIQVGNGRVKESITSVAIQLLILEWLGQGNYRSNMCGWRWQRHCGGPNRAKVVTPRQVHMGSCGRGSWDSLYIPSPIRIKLQEAWVLMSTFFLLLMWLVQIHGSTVSMHLWLQVSWSLCQTEMVVSGTFIAGYCFLYTDDFCWKVLGF
jgi:hypothetical protein